MNLHITIVAKGDPPLFADMTENLVGNFPLGHVMIIEKGMASGSVSVMLVIPLEGGKMITAQISAKMFLMVASTVRGACQRFGDRASLE